MKNKHGGKRKNQTGRPTIDGGFNSTTVVKMTTKDRKKLEFLAMCNKQSMSSYIRDMIRKEYKENVI
tara:strand:- start:1811 stop:2011 length:201 start_codon:yes stop_codon:yes gene_type:complete